MKFKKGSFVRSVIVLTTGTVIAQSITYLISPILTRIYSTEEMGDFGLYMRAIGFISALATARYEFSLPLPKNDTHSYLLYRVSIRIASIIFLACGVLGFIYMLTQPFNLNQLLFVVITLLSAGCMVLINLGTNWSIRKKHFKKISYSRISNSFVSNGLRLGFGLINMGSIGLILASLIGYFVSSFAFVKDYFQLKKLNEQLFSKKKTYVLLKEYRQFPQVSLPHVVVDLGRDLLVAGLIVHFFSKDIFGSYSHSFTILRLPLVLIGTSIGQVFFNKCTEMINDGKPIDKVLEKTLGTLILLSIIPFTIIFLWGEPIFSFVFGEKWADAGYYSEIMAIWLMFNFLLSPISNIPMILNRQKEYFYLGMVSTLSQLICFGLLPILWGTSREAFIQILWVVSISQAIILVGIFFMTIFYAKVGVRQR